MVDFLPFLLLSTAACSFAIDSFSSELIFSGTGGGGAGKGCTGGSGGIFGVLNNELIII